MAHATADNLNRPERDPYEPPVSPEAVRAGYETSQVSVRGLAIFLVGFVLTAAVLHVAFWFLMRALDRRVSTFDTPRSAVSVEHDAPQPPLQPSVGHDALPYQDMDALRIDEDVMFKKIGWQVDFTTHRATIPESIARRVADEARARAAAPAVPATTTGKPTNSIVPNGVPPYDTTPYRLPAGVPHGADAGGGKP